MNHKELRKLLIFLAGSLLLCYLVDKGVFYAIEFFAKNLRSGQGLGKLNQFLEKKDSIYLFVFGSSRANTHIDVSRYPEAAYNMGLEGRSISYASTLIKLLPSKQQQVILLHIDTDNIFNPNYSGSDIEPLKSKYHQIPSIAYDLKAREQISPLQDFFWCLDYNNTIVSIVRNLISPAYDHKKYQGFNASKLTTAQKVKRDSLLSNLPPSECSQKYEVSPLYIELLQQIKDFCLLNEKRLILFTAPIYQDQCPEDNRFLQELLEEMNLIYWDYTSLSSVQEDSKYWKDQTHLSDIGASLFTLDILKKVQGNIPGTLTLQ